VLPGLREWVFSAKTFASSMIALWIALYLNLDRPYWAMMTVYIVAQPLTGAMRSKAAFRFAGTLLGAVAAIALVPNLVAVPWMLTAALALWVGICIYFALLDRTPRSYVFLLAGFTAAIIGFPCVDTPDAIFDTALARVEETTLAIVCTTLIGAAVFPRPLGPALLARIDDWFSGARNLSLDALRGAPEVGEIGGIRRSLAADAVEIRMLTTHLAYDTSNLQSATRPMEVLERRILLLFPTVSAIADRLATLRAIGGVPATVQVLVDRLAAWIAAGDDAPQAEATRLHAEIQRAEPAIGAASGWSAILQTALLMRLRDLVDIVHDVRALRLQIAAGRPDLPALALPHGIAPDATRFRDHGMAVLSAVSATLATSLVSAFWIITAWPEGGGAATFAAVGCSFFAAQDDPAPAILQFLRYVLISVAIGAVYLFVILPKVAAFEMLALVFAPVFLLFGVLIAMPATNFLGMAITVNVAAMLTLSSVYNADFPTYVNNSIAVGVGMGSAATLTRIFRSVGAVWSARRLMRANRRDIARAALRRDTTDRATLAALTLDRLCELAPRLAASAPQADKVVADALLELRTGLNVINLQHDRADLPAEASAAVDTALHGIAGHILNRAPREPDDELRRAIDHAIVAVTSTASPRIGQLLLELVGIRHNLFPNAPPYQPAPAPPSAAVPEKTPA
jgi:uncharacterized membrane protein YccC